MSHIPARIAETGPFEIQTGRGGVTITAPFERMPAHSDSDYGRIELGFDDMPHLRACLDQAEWGRLGWKGRPFEGVALCWEVLGRDGELLARVADKAQAEQMADLARSILPGGGVSVERREHSLAPVLVVALEVQERARAEAEEAETARTWSLIFDSMMARTPVSFARVDDGAVRQILTGIVSGIDRMTMSIQIDTNPRVWIEVSAVRHMRTGAGDDLRAALGDAAGQWGSERMLAEALAEAGQ